MQFLHLFVEHLQNKTTKPSTHRTVPHRTDTKRYLALCVLGFNDGGDTSAHVRLQTNHHRDHRITENLFMKNTYDV